MIEAGYLILTVVLVVVILAGYKTLLGKLETRGNAKRFGIAAIVIGLWLAYVYLISASGFLKSFTIPPRFPLFLVLPLFVFTGVFLYQNRNSELLRVMPKSWAVYFQSFRVAVELLFIGSLAEGVLHREVTFHGYNYDILVGLTAPIIAFLAFQLRVVSEKAVLVWNYVGLGILATVVFMFVSTTFLPSIWGETNTWVNPELATFPYTLIAGFLMPAAVFMHVLSIIQLSKNDY